MNSDRKPPEKPKPLKLVTKEEVGIFGPVEPIIIFWIAIVIMLIFK